ncbi:MAG: SDR family NAD(P)-dependent oxidoreductase [Verrucomicrobia bacterium]|nr:SDR family NAD(P)-dependent oxidoreductase [Verrucomicrobiota bacterium]
MSPEFNRQLSEKVAVVTGASSGVGRSIALALAAEGADLALLGRRTSLLELVKQECTDRGVRAVCYRVDLLEERELGEIKERVLSDFAGVDILVHSAGMIAFSKFAMASAEDFELQHRCNVLAPFALTQLFLATLIERQGHVIFINSTAGLVGTPGVSQYSATKHALKGLADSLRDEVNPEGVRVLSVYLGRTATPMQAKVHQWENKSYAPEQLIQPEQVAKVVLVALLIGPEAEITEVRIRPAKKPGRAK